MTGSAITIKKMKVRPKRHIPLNMCARPLGVLLNCWAAFDDPHATGKCAEAAQQLYHCMRTAPLPAKRHAPTTNYHLSRLGKDLK